MSVRLSAFAASIRLANFPSVWCNAFTGVGLLFLTKSEGDLNQAATLPLLLCVTCLYGSGNLLNDWWDRGWDCIHRPERALPQQVFTPWFYLVASVALGASGFGFAWIASPQTSVAACVILVAILVYTLLHKKSSLACIAMAFCRGALPWLGLLATSSHPSTWPMTVVCAVALFSLALFIHTLSISLSSRICPPIQEGPPAIGVALMTGVFAASTAVASACLLPCFQWFFSFAALPYIAAIALSVSVPYRQNPHRRVSWLLACFPLLDAVVLIPLSNLLQYPEATACLILPPVCFVVARWLQRSIPAT